MKLIFHSHYTDQVAQVSTSDLAETFEREALFYAANRVESYADQCRYMKWRWQQHMRALIDVVEMPSMSVGDKYLLLSEAGTVVSSGECMAFGWRDLEVGEMAALLERAGAL